ncbi:SulP family inorganic anion transporter [Streptomyces sp. NPDC002589]|uniref:SulP family inorganic anion transporter n=1 Tax=Streptomyces sp. NPDC002589 TaxID=3154420 RepID=UPI003331BCB4
MTARWWVPGSDRERRQMAQGSDGRFSSCRRLVPGLGALMRCRRSWWNGDLLVGVTEAACLVPQVMACAGVAGLPPAAGLSIRRLSSSLLRRLAFLFTVKRYVPQLPGPLLAVILATTAVAVVHIDGRHRLKVISSAPSGLPSLALPDWASCRTSCCPRSLLRWAPPSQAHSLAAGAAVLAVLRFLSPLLARTPSAVLGALVMYAAVRMIDVAGFRRLESFRKRELLLALSCLVGLLAYGVIVAIGLSMAERRTWVARACTTQWRAWCLAWQARTTRTTTRQPVRSPGCWSTATTRRCSSPMPRPSEAGPRPPSTPWPVRIAVSAQSGLEDVEGGSVRASRRPDRCTTRAPGP